MRKDNDDFKQNMTKLITILKGVLERQNNLSEFSFKKNNVTCQSVFIDFISRGNIHSLTVVVNLPYVPQTIIIATKHKKLSKFKKSD